MINRITTTAFFQVNGASLRADYQPQTGITAVVGENGSGKTFLSIEAVRWLLFGKAALRGAAADYKQAETQGTLTIRGARYEISRGKHEWIKDATGATIAKGAEKVTEKVTELLGYGLDVFDLCNAATQGNVQALGAMRPAQRKALVDSVLRLTDAEKAEKDCREEAKGFKREAEALAKMLRAPGDAPQPPQHYLPSASVRARLKTVRELIDTAAALSAKLATPIAPTPPEGTAPTSEAIAELERYVDEQRALHGRHRDLGVASHGAKWSADQLDAAETRMRVRKAIDARGDRPILSREDIETGWIEHRAAAAHRASEPVTCPNCGTSFRPTGEAPSEPRWSRAVLDMQEARLRAWPDAGPNLPDGLDLTENEIARGRSALKAHEELCNLPPLGPDKAGELANLRRLFHHHEAYAPQLASYRAAVAAQEAVQRELDALGPLPTSDGLQALYEELSAAERYEADCRAFDAADAAYKDTQAKIVEANHLAEEYALGGKDVAAARAAVKALIAPKISRIASALIRDMSMGKLRDVVVDDEMEITVGGQRIETLSGAGKTVANLALRVAMGQALVGHVFPVFLADEIDGDLSAARREATLQALVGLKKHMKQIILVTHRGADIADQVWDVESTQ